MANESVTASYRISSEIKQKVQELMKNEKLSADAMFTALISAYEESAFKSTDYGQAMSNDLDAWAMHSAALQQLYTNAIRNGVDAKEIVRKELSDRISASEAAVSSLKEKLEAKDARINEFSAQINALNKALDEATKEIDRLEKTASTAEENAEAWKSSINTLTSQLNECKEKVQNYDEINNELLKAKAEITALQKTNELQEQFIDKYMRDNK